MAVVAAAAEGRTASQAPEALGMAIRGSTAVRALCLVQAMADGARSGAVAQAVSGVRRELVDDQEEDIRAVLPHLGAMPFIKTVTVSV